MMKTTPESKAGKAFIWLTDPISSLSLRENKARTQAEQEAGVRECSRVHGRTPAYWLRPHGFLSLLPYTTQDHLPKEAPPKINH